MARGPLFQRSSSPLKALKALNACACGVKETILILAIALWSAALIMIPRSIAARSAADSGAFPHVLSEPEVELAAECAARRGSQVLSIDVLTSDEWIDLSAEDFESRYLRASRPVVMRDALTGTDAMSTWDNDDQIRWQFGSWEVLVKEEGSIPRSDSLSNFLDRYKGSNGRLHLTQRMTKRMAGQIILPEVMCQVVEFGEKTDVQVSMMSGSHKGPIHCDSEDALLMQFDGSKTVYLADPGYFKALGIKRGSLRRRAFHDIAASPVDFWHPDTKVFPEFKQVRWLRVEVQPGDMLYIPAYWFHVIQSEGDRNLVVNHWFKPPADDGEAYDDGDSGGVIAGVSSEDECCHECWPCRIRSYCRHRLGTNPKFRQCDKTLNLEGLLTPGYQMKETAGMFQSKDDMIKGFIGSKKKKGGSVKDTIGGEDQEAEDVVRDPSEPDLALHSPIQPNDGIDNYSDDAVEPEDGDFEVDGSTGFPDVEGGEEFEETDGEGGSEEEDTEQGIAGDKDYDGTGPGDNVI